MGRISNSRERMLDAARDLIWKQNYGTVTIDAICAEADVRKGSFYYFFDSKSDLATAAFESLWACFKLRLDQIFSASTPPLDRLNDYFRFLYERQTETKLHYGRVLGCPFCFLGSELSQDEAVFRNARTVVACYRKYLETALRDAQAEGLLEIENIPVAAQKLSAYVQGCLLQARIENDVSLLRDLGPGAFGLIRSLANPPMRSKRESKTAVLKISANSRF